MQCLSLQNIIFVICLCSSVIKHWKYQAQVNYQSLLVTVSPASHDSHAFSGTTDRTGLVASVFTDDVVSYLYTRIYCCTFLFLPISFERINKKIKCFAIAKCMQTPPNFLNRKIKKTVGERKHQQLNWTDEIQAEERLKVRALKKFTCTARLFWR